MNILDIYEGALKTKLWLYAPTRDVEAPIFQPLPPPSLPLPPLLPKFIIIFLANNMNKMH